MLALNKRARWGKWPVRGHFFRRLIVREELLPYFYEKLLDDSMYLYEIPQLVPLILFSEISTYVDAEGDLRVNEVTFSADQELTWRKNGPEMLSRALKRQELHLDLLEPPPSQRDRTAEDGRRRTVWGGMMGYLMARDRQNDMSESAPTWFGNELMFWELLKLDVLDKLICDQGASPNAFAHKSHAIPSRVWMKYLLVSFDIAPDTEREYLYLRMLGAFLTMSPQFSLPGWIRPVYLQFSSRITEARSERPWSVNYRLLSDVTHRLLSCAHSKQTQLEAPWPSEFIADAIERGFPPDYRDTLKMQHPEIFAPHSARSTPAVNKLLPLPQPAAKSGRP